MKKLSAASVLIAGIAFAASANAATVMQTGSFTFGEAAATVTVTAGNTGSATNSQTLGFGTINRFDTALGTLNSVTFDIS